MEILPSKQLNFEDTEIAFKNKSDKELKQAYWLFKMIGSDFLTKMGSFLTNFALNIGLPIKGIIKSTIFRQFCGGETIAECEHTIEQLHKGGVGTILDYSVEGEDNEAVFDFTCQEIIGTVLKACCDERIPLTVFKITGIGRFALLEKLDAQEKLTSTQEIEFAKVKARFEKICQTAYDKKVPIMIDAEETWIQKTIDKLALEMMKKFNKEQLIVYNTYQMYRCDKLADMKADVTIAKKAGFILGAKIVRGAYMEKERKRAEEMGYPSPIQPNKAACDNDYNESLRFAVQNIAHVGIVCGTHNQDSCALLAGLLADYNIAHNHPHVFFSQLLGMGDNLSFNLSNARYNAAKYVPYGPIKAVMPYLLRRAQENTSITGQTGRELSLISKEKIRRKL